MSNSTMFFLFSIICGLFLISFLVYSRLISPNMLSAISSVNNRPVMFIKTEIEKYSEKKIDKILFPDWLRKEWANQLGYSNVKFANGDIKENVLIQKKLNDVLIKSNIINIYFAKNEIIGFEDNEKIFVIQRYKERLIKITDKPIIEVIL